MDIDNNNEIVERMFKLPYVFDNDNFYVKSGDVLLFFFSQEFSKKISLENRQKLLNIINGKKENMNFYGVKFIKKASAVYLQKHKVIDFANISSISRDRQITPKVAGIMRTRLAEYIVNKLNQSIS